MFVNPSFLLSPARMIPEETDPPQPSFSFQTCLLSPSQTRVGDSMTKHDSTSFFNPSSKRVGTRTRAGFWTR
ncbi:hypothetical protein IE53DRAFT_387346 [Violaceomyces palustris]|uniref:Uncharacterized protein n=1 Tax=Violaceomyces palustris TaxID=1673888 RepID=A0ACD0NX21_9BASI|nr:hypothetical protein IE53DRAFT_387346 [Violaceomyces palustris]